MDMRRARHPNMSAKLLIGRLGFKRVYLETISIAAEIPRHGKSACADAVQISKAEQDNCKEGVVQPPPLRRHCVIRVCFEFAKWQR